MTEIKKKSEVDNMENANVKTNNKNNTIIFNTDIPKDPEELFYMVYSKVNSSDQDVGIDTAHVVAVAYEGLSIKTESKNPGVQSEVLASQNEVLASQSEALAYEFAFRKIATNDKYIVSVVKLSLENGYWRGEFLGHKVFTTHEEVLEYLADLTVKHIDPDSIISSIRVNVCL